MKTKIPVQSSFWLVVVIVATVILPPLAIDEFTPSMPAMLRSLSTTTAMLQLTVTVYMFAFAISQCLSGYLSDGLGRRGIVIWTYPLFFIGSLVCMFTHDSVWLLIGRFIQGFGVGACAMVGPALMSDCLADKELAKVSSYYSTFYSFIPISAPIIGGFIQDGLGWRYNFGFMLLVAVVTYGLFLLKLEETHQPTAQHALSVKGFFRTLMHILSNAKYISSVGCLILVWSPIPIFSILAPFIMQNVLGFSASVYGLQALLVGLGFFAGNLINGVMIRAVESMWVIVLGLLVMTASAIIMLIFPLLHVLNAWTIMVPVFVIMAGGGMVFPNLYAKAVSAVPEFGGFAGAMIGGCILIGSVILTGIITQLHAHSALSLSGVYVIMTLACGLIYSISLSKGEV